MIATELKHRPSWAVVREKQPRRERSNPAALDSQCCLSANYKYSIIYSRHIWADEVQPNIKLFKTSECLIWKGASSWRWKRFENVAELGGVCGNGALSRERPLSTAPADSDGTQPWPRPHWVTYVPA